MCALCVCMSICVCITVCGERVQLQADIFVNSFGDYE